MKSTRKTTILAMFALCPLAAAHAQQQVIGGTYVYLSPLKQTTTFINPLQNTTGLNSRSLLVSCWTNTAIIAISPDGSNNQEIELCNPQAKGHVPAVVNGPYDFALPAGWGLQFFISGQYGNKSLGGAVVISYDQQAGARQSRTIR